MKNGASEEIPLRPLRSAHVLVIEKMLESLETGVPHTLDASSARATLEVLMAVYESSRRRSVIELPLNVPENPLFDMLDSGEV